MVVRQHSWCLPSLGEMLGNLYGSLREPERLDAFMGALGTRLRSHLVAIQSDDGSRAHSVRRHFGIDARPSQLAVRDDAKINQYLLRGADTLLSEGVLDCARFFRPGELERTAFYADVLVPMDVHHSLGVLIAREGQRFVGLSASRCRRSPGFADADLDLLRWLQPHLNVAHALQAQQALWHTPGTNEAASTVATFCLGTETELLYANPAGRGILEKSESPLRQRGRKLWLERRSDREVMAGRLAGLDSANEKDAATHWAIHDAAGGIWAIAAARPVTLEGLPADLLLSVPRTVVRVRLLESVSSGRMRALRQTFELTNAEAELAGSLLDFGSLAACRPRLGKSYETLRTQLRALFAKTGTSCQADLIRKLQIVCDL